MATQTPKDVLKFAKDNKVEAVDLKFLDLLGIWQHFTIPTSELGEDLFEEGSGFDGSSIRGWQPINASDMLVVPDPTTAVVDPFTAIPTLSLIPVVLAVGAVGLWRSKRRRENRASFDGCQDRNFLPYT